MVKTRRELKREREEELEKATMTSIPGPPPMVMPGVEDSSSKPIPLVCSVCPSTPSFSDSSHLLTHIASKGHLHHETQTKLRAHQDLAAMYALQQYEQWYRDNNIETLLVDRLKAKQDKEAAKVKRGRGTPSAAPARQARKKPKRSASTSTTVKTEQDEFASLFPFMLPQFGLSDQDSEFMEDFPPLSELASGEAMSLKGQVFPGMGKMDLANDEMKRTRNQRKPKSVVDRMRRTSEGIESTQVVMTADFEVKRVKDVYDDESPDEGNGEQSPPRKITRTRRKKAQPLADLPTNVPRSAAGSVSRETSTSSAAAPKPSLRQNQFMGAMVTTPMGQLRPTIDVFRDEDSKSAFEPPTMAPQLKREPRYGDHFAMHTVNPISHSNISSPSPSLREIPRMTSHKDTSRPRFQAYPYYNGGHLAFPSFSRNESDYPMNDPTLYSNGPGFPYGTYNGTAHDPYRMHLPVPSALKQDQYSTDIGGDALGNNEHNLFLNFPSASPNPLLSQDRALFNSFNQGSNQQPGSPLGFASINRTREYAYSAAHGHDVGHETPSQIKLEQQSYQVIGSDRSSDGQEQNPGQKIVWGEHGSEDDLPLHDALSKASAA